IPVGLRSRQPPLPPLRPANPDQTPGHPLPLHLLVPQLPARAMTLWVYVLASHSRTLYVGVTNELSRRLLEHKQHVSSTSFTSRYHVDRLVYCEETNDAIAALEREKQLKKWNRAKKVALIESINPHWNDLFE